MSTTSNQSEETEQTQSGVPKQESNIFESIEEEMANAFNKVGEACQAVMTVGGTVATIAADDLGVLVKGSTEHAQKAYKAAREDERLKEVFEAADAAAKSASQFARTASQSAQGVAKNMASAMDDLTKAVNNMVDIAEKVDLGDDVKEKEEEVRNAVNEADDIVDKVEEVIAEVSNAVEDVKEAEKSLKMD